MKSKLNIIIIGSGNVANQLAIAFFEKKCNILQIVGRNKKEVTALAKKVKSKASFDFKSIDKFADIYVIAVKDDAIELLASKLKLGNALVVHTSGAVNASVLKKCSKNYGVFYPLQTISKDKKTKFKKVPICIEANNTFAIETLKKAATIISNKVQIISSEQRKIIHLAAVFACNFTNYMYAVSEKILKENKLSFDLLHTLITETAEKATHCSPSKNQTGPAIREDKKTMQAHLLLLKKDKPLQEMYKLLSTAIIKIKNNK